MNCILCYYHVVVNYHCYYHYKYCHTCYGLYCLSQMSFIMTSTFIFCMVDRVRKHSLVEWTFANNAMPQIDWVQSARPALFWHDYCRLKWPDYSRLVCWHELDSVVAITHSCYCCLSVKVLTYWMKKKAPWLFWVLFDYWVIHLVYLQTQKKAK